MDLACRRQVRPGSGRVRVTVMDDSGPLNPAPAPKVREEAGKTVELYSLQERLELLCGTKDLSRVSSLEMCVDTQENSLGNFGSYLPRLVLLRMNNSVLTSVRDLGISLSHLQVLWMSSCSLQDLDGISTLSSLRELYLAFNKVTDLSQVQYLGLCGKLQTLTLEGNPVCLRPNPTTTQIDYSYCDAVKELVPQLRHLDNARVEDGRFGPSSTPWEDWAILQNCLRDSSPASTKDQAEASSRPSSARHSISSFCAISLASTTGSRPVSATSSGFLCSPVSIDCSVDSELAEVEEDGSLLTHGAGKILFCGNPIRAIRARREKLRIGPCISTSIPRDLSMYAPAHMYDPQDADTKESGDVLAEVSAWREKHSRFLQAIERDRLSEILVVRHSNDNEADHDEEVEGFHVLSSDSCAEEHCVDSLDTTPSKSSSFKTVCTDEFKSESFDVDHLFCDITRSPCPPLSSKSASVRNKPIGIHARRIQINLVNSEHKPHSCSEGHKVVNVTSTSTAQTDLPLKQVTRTNKFQPSSSRGGRLKNSCVEMDLGTLARNVKCQSSWTEQQLQVPSD
ncbi:leucine-rich repeat-containing protein 56 isoform X2 [Syngnathoides biaculeatus]|uniref:leucine-rich repeat-containing protein 56 isoform X2 n=1 Tax=Syngnathoides biaculeatus TaxID=300417 RepID=UPI002ADD45D7|nr:leucine-rich repeat-containing protein 56 isoform X2 [Syngnathoides biaculeatus]